MKTIERTDFLKEIALQHEVHPICALLGPRQVGKTTLAKQYAKNFKNPIFFDLENPIDQQRLGATPLLTLQELTHDLIIIDEIQRVPELFPTLRYLVDQRAFTILILGSASRDLIAQASETLAGRIGYIELPPLTLAECEIQNYKKRWLRGGFPRSFLEKTDESSMLWRESYITTFMERDIPQLGFSIPPLLMRRLWMMLAHNHGNIVNLSDIGRSLAITHNTVRSYIDILQGTFMIRLLQPWFENISKRQVKTPKVYIRDSGIIHGLLNLQTSEDLLVYPKLGALWEGFALEATIDRMHTKNEEIFFWGTQGGAELDLLLFHKGKRIGFEYKFSDRPQITKSMESALNDLHLNHLFVIYPHATTFPLSPKITACGLTSPEFLQLSALINSF